MCKASWKAPHIDGCSGLLPCCEVGRRSKTSDEGFVNSYKMAFFSPPPLLPRRDVVHDWHPVWREYEAAAWLCGPASALGWRDGLLPACLSCSGNEAKVPARTEEFKQPHHETYFKLTDQRTASHKNEAPSLIRSWRKLAANNIQKVKPKWIQGVIVRLLLLLFCLTTEAKRGRWGLPFW